MKQTAIMRATSILCVIYAVIYTLAAIAAAGGGIYVWHICKTTEMGEGLQALAALLTYLFGAAVMAVALLAVIVSGKFVLLHLFAALVGKQMRRMCLNKPDKQLRYVVIDSSFKIFCSILSFVLFLLLYYCYIYEIWVLAVGIVLACILALPSILNLLIGIWKKHRKNALTAHE